jgi:hypothetical protein
MSRETLPPARVWYVCPKPDRRSHRIHVPACETCGEPRVAVASRTECVVYLRCPDCCHVWSAQSPRVTCRSRASTRRRRMWCKRVWGTRGSTTVSPVNRSDRRCWCCSWAVAAHITGCVRDGGPWPSHPLKSGWTRPSRQPPVGRSALVAIHPIEIPRVGGRGGEGTWNADWRHDGDMPPFHGTGPQDG